MVTHIVTVVIDNIAQNRSKRAKEVAAQEASPQVNPFTLFFSLQPSRFLHIAQEAFFMLFLSYFKAILKLLFKLLLSYFKAILKLPFELLLSYFKAILKLPFELLLSYFISYFQPILKLLLSDFLAIF